MINSAFLQYYNIDLISTIKVMLNNNYFNFKTNIMNPNKVKEVENKLKVLHKDAKKDVYRVGKGIVRSIFRPIQPADFENAYLPISKEQGEALRQLIIDNNCKQVVEFGTSFGISTIYLADAVRETGGKVITTELLESKGKRALQNIKEAGLNDYVELRIGDAMKTLKDFSTPIDFLFLDGWKDLYLPLFKMLEPNFHAKTLIYADNIDMAGTQEYTNYVSSKEIYFSQLMHYNKGLLTQLS